MTTTGTHFESKLPQTQNYVFLGYLRHTNVLLPEKAPILMGNREPDLLVRVRL